MTTIPQSEIASCTNPSGWQIVGDDYDPTSPLYRSADGWCKPYSYDGSVDEGMYNYDPSMAAVRRRFLAALADPAGRRLLHALRARHAHLRLPDHPLEALVPRRRRALRPLRGCVFGVHRRTDSAAVGWIGRLMSGIKNDMSAASRSKFLLRASSLAHRALTPTQRSSA